MRLREWTALCWGCAIAMGLGGSSPVLAQAGGDAAGDAGAASKQELAKKLANPISDLVSIPFQFNWENGVGPDDGLRTVLNIQPVVPFRISEKWNLIGR